jgi:hypothetical protein
MIKTLILSCGKLFVEENFIIRKIGARGMILFGTFIC